MSLANSSTESRWRMTTWCVTKPRKKWEHGLQMRREPSASDRRRQKWGSYWVNRWRRNDWERQARRHSTMSRQLSGPRIKKIMSLRRDAYRVRSRRSTRTTRPSFRGRWEPKKENKPARWTDRNSSITRDFLRRLMKRRKPAFKVVHMKESPVPAIDLHISLHICTSSQY